MTKRRTITPREEIRILSDRLRKIECADPTPANTRLLLRLSDRIGELRIMIDPTLKRPMGRPRTKPEEPPNEETSLQEEVLKLERQMREENTGSK